MFDWKAINRSTMSAVAASVVATVSFLWWKQRTSEARKKQRNCWPSVKGRLPFLGNLPAHGMSRLFEQIYIWAEQYGQDQGMFEFSLFGTTFLVVCHKDRIWEISSARPYKVVRNTKVKSIANGIGAKGLFTAEGEQWKLDRRLVVPALNRKNVRLYFDSMKVVARRLVQKWSKLSLRSLSIAIHHDLYSVSIDTLSLTVYGRDSNTLENASDQMSKDVVRILDVSLTRMFAPFPYWEIPIIGPYLDGGGWIKTRLLKALDEMIARHLSEEKGNKNADTKTFLEKILKLNRESEDCMPRERLIGQLLTLFLGGSDSVGTLLTTAFWLLSVDEELQEELALEVRESIENLKDIEMETMMTRLPRTRSFLMELSRCYGPSPLIFLTAAEDVPFRKHGVVSRGTEIVLLTRTAGMHSTVSLQEIPLGPEGEDASQFCPRRWLVARGDNNIVEVQLPSIKSFVYTSWGHGVRHCPGKDLAELEIMNCIVHVLQTFKISLDPTHQNADFTLQNVQLMLNKR